VITTPNAPPAPRGQALDRALRPARRGRDDRGVALVEFAIIAPLIFLLLFGIIEFGWTFYQLNDVRQSARETSRLAAVNYRTSAVSGSTQTQQIVDEVCARMEEGDVEIIITKSGSAVGDAVTVTVQREYEALTGFLTSFYNPSSINSTVETRLEQKASFDNETLDAIPFQDCP
jgi:Flp pilus assembly protein TadG